MRIQELHPWDVTPAQARQIQQRLAHQVRLVPLPSKISLVAGADVASARGEEVIFAAVVVLDFPSLEVVEAHTAVRPAAFPYVPGLLTFREGPALLDAFRQVQRTPDVVILDGQGLAHPRRFGLACHMGLWLGVPTVGCAKSRLIGQFAPLGQARGEWTPLCDGPQQVGAVLRTRAGVRPVFVSPGHLCDFDTSRRLVMDCCTRFRLPEPTRQAHMAVTALRRQRPDGRFSAAGPAPGA